MQRLNCNCGECAKILTVWKFIFWQNHCYWVLMHEGDQNLSSWGNIDCWKGYRVWPLKSPLYRNSYPVISAILTNPLRFFRCNVALPGLASRASAAPPTTTIAAFPPPSLLHRWMILSFDTSHIPKPRYSSRKKGNRNNTETNHEGAMSVHNS